MTGDIVDLHVHSTMSDGTYSPEELVEKAEMNGLWGFALTDHDTVKGISAASEMANKNNVKFIHGIEIGTQDLYGNLHILGYFYDLPVDKFESELEWVRKARNERNYMILEKLKEYNISLSMSDVEKYAQGDVVGRLHIGKAMYATGAVSSLGEAFKGYLNSGGVCYVPRNTFTSTQAIELIHGYGGIVCLAHPFLIPDQRMDRGMIIKGLIEQGLDAIEVYYVEHTPEQTRELETIAQRNGLLKTGGTDFHGGNKPGVDIGVGRGDMQIPKVLMQRLFEKMENKLGG